MVASEQMLDQGAEAFIFEAIEVGVFEKREIARAANGFYLAEDGNSVLLQLE